MNLSQFQQSGMMFSNFLRDDTGEDVCMVCALGFQVVHLCQNSLKFPFFPLIYCDHYSECIGPLGAAAVTKDVGFWQYRASFVELNVPISAFNVMP